jgi:hypothetical protein
MSNFTSTQMKTEAFEKLEFDIEQMKIVDYYCLNKKKMISLLTKHLSKQ